VLVEDVIIQSPAHEDCAPAIDLAATLYLPTNAPSSGAPGLIVGHGAGSQRSRHAEFCTEACASGFAVLALDFRGHGDSGGSADGPLELDLCAAAEWLRKHPAVEASRICYRGSSMGGFYGLKAAPAARFDAMALLCPASETVILNALDQADSGVETPTGEKARWDVQGMRAYFERQNCSVLAGLIECPSLLIHTRHDDVVPFDHTLLIVRALRVDATLVALEDGSHTSAQHDPCMHRHTIDWLRSQLISCSERT
jgi:uncharacterized protein